MEKKNLRQIYSFPKTISLFQTQKKLVSEKNEYPTSRHQCNRPTLYLAIFIICQDAPRAAGKEIRLSQEKSVGSADFKPY